MEALIGCPLESLSLATAGPLAPGLTHVETKLSYSPPAGQTAVLQSSVMEHDGHELNAINGRAAPRGRAIDARGRWYRRFMTEKSAMRR